MPINWNDIIWMPIGILAGLVFLSSLVGHSLTRNAFVGAIIAVILFVALFIFWEHYPLDVLKRFPIMKR